MEKARSIKNVNNSFYLCLQLVFLYVGMFNRKENTHNKGKYNMRSVLLNLSALLLLGALFNVQVTNFVTGIQANKFEKFYREQLKFSHPTADISKSNDDTGLPFGLESIETVTFEKNESSDEDINDADISPILSVRFAPFEFLTFEISKNSLIRSELSFFHRKTIPLFVLQHSWKTFLS